jgi:PKD repeat protein
VFTYNVVAPATITVTLTVTDNAGDTGTATTTVNVLAAANTPPVADAGLAVNGTANSPVQFDGSASNDPEGAALTFSWDFGDGASGSGATPSHTYSRCGTYSVSLTVTDDPV